MSLCLYDDALNFGLHLVCTYAFSYKIFYRIKIKISSKIINLRQVDCEMGIKFYL